MASSKYKIGLVNVLMGNIASDGDMGTSLTAIGDTVADSASMTTSSDTTTDFNIEESSSPVLSIVTTPGAIEFKWSTYNNNVDNLVRVFGGTKVAGSAARSGVAATLGTIVPGTGYTNGSYTNVTLTNGVIANITVSGGAVTAVTIVYGGSGSSVGTSLTTANTNIGGTGSGFSVPVATITTAAATGDSWQAPDTFIEVEQSLQLLWKSGGGILIPRAKLSASLNMSFKKSQLSQLDITATVLQPTKAGVPRLTLQSDIGS